MSGKDALFGKLRELMKRRERHLFVQVPTPSAPPSTPTTLDPERDIQNPTNPFLFERRTSLHPLHPRLPSSQTLRALLEAGGASSVTPQETTALEAQIQAEHAEMADDEQAVDRALGLLVEPDCGRADPQYVFEPRNKNIIINKPIPYPQYAAESERLRSFEGRWPPQMKQTPEKLAKAGLFYKGYGDQAVCYRCDGGMYNWAPEDDPMTEHAGYFSDCVFVRLELSDAEILAAKRFVGERDGKATEVFVEEKKTTEIMQPLPSKSKDMTEEEVRKAYDELLFRFECNVCFENQIDTAFMPCGHLAVCHKCAGTSSTCCLCREKVDKYLQLFC